LYSYGPQKANVLTNQKYHNFTPTQVSDIIHISVGQLGLGDGNMMQIRVHIRLHLRDRPVSHYLRLLKNKKSEELRRTRAYRYVNTDC
jgi:hypothetical protein